MKLKLLRLTPRISDKKIVAYIDLEVIDLKFKLKGIKIAFIGSKAMFNMPYLLTEEGVKYSPFNFVEDADFKDFKNSVFELIQKVYPLANWGKGIYDIESLNKKPE